MYLNHKRTSEADQIRKGFNGFDLVVHNCLINASIEQGNLDEACKLFDEMPERNDVSWTALMSGFLRSGRVEEAIWYFERNPFHNVFSWTAAISGFAKNGLTFEALKLFVEMLRSGVRPNAVTFSSVVQIAAGLGDIRLGMSIWGLVVKAGFDQFVAILNSLITFSLRLGHLDLACKIFEQMENKDVISWTAMLDVYVEMGDLREARRVFDEMPVRNEVSWSAMISKYSQSGYPEEAVKLFSQMIGNGFSPNKSCFASAINAYASLKALQAGTNVHALVVKVGVGWDVYISCSLIDLYCSCGNVIDARVIFDLIPNKNVVCWNSMVSGYSNNGLVEAAKELFDQIPGKNTVSWNSMISGYSENEQYDKVLEVFDEMLSSGERPDKSTYSSVLCACAGIASLEKGKALHGNIVKLGFRNDIIMGTALVDMYAKSGDTESSKKVFTRMPKKNDVSWTAMIQGLSESGFAKESLYLFEEMKRNSLVKPNELILLSVLFACSHCGLVDKGLEYFDSMERVYNVKPNERHYTCVVDMLSRSGRLNEAENFITNMPFEANVNAWAALLSGCKTYKNDRIAEKAAEKIKELAEKKCGGYVMLSNIYASAGRWGDVLETRKMMKEKGLKKGGGCSWIEVRNKVHSFYSQDGTHSQFDQIYSILHLLNSEM